MKQGQTITITKGYAISGYQVAAGESFPAAYGEFPRDGRARKLVRVLPGQQVAALTDADDGRIFAMIEAEDGMYACALLDGTYQ